MKDLYQNKQNAALDKGFRTDEIFVETRLS